MADVVTFTELRPLLFSIAYRMLGSVAEAEDVLQEAFIRWERVDGSEVTSPKAFLSSVVTRLCIDQLRAAQARREEYVGPWLPEPLLVDDIDPGERAELSDSLSTAFLVVLESLSPLERAAFLLRKVFRYPYPEIAEMLDRSEASCRQLVHRAREHVSAKRKRFDATRQQQDSVLERFLAACATGDLEELMALLTDDASLISDGGRKTTAARRPIFGREKVARFVRGVTRKRPEHVEIQIARINSAPGIVLTSDGDPWTVLTLDCAGDRIQAIHIVANPDKLRSLRLGRMAR